MAVIEKGSQLRFGIVGCGRVVQELHLPAWSAIPEATLVAICDSSQASLDAVSKLAPDARRYTSFDDFIADSAGLSFVDLATPGVTHRELGQKLLAKGISLLCEKPLALNSFEAHRLCAQAEESGAMLTSIHNYRFKENAQRALRALHGGQLGDVVSVNLKFRSGALFGEQVPWRRYERENRTLLFDSGIHLVDIALMFLGPVASIRYVDADVDSAGLQRVVFGTAHENGSRGAFDLMVDASCSSTEIEVLGESLGLSLQFFPNGLRMLPARDDPFRRSLGEARRLFDFAAATVGDKLLRRKCSHRARSHALLFQAFVGALGGTQPNPVPSSEVLRTIDLLDQVALRAYGTSASFSGVPQNGVAAIETESDTRSRQHE
jgi:predicted dehydrogenase